MEQYAIKGGNPLVGEVEIGGAKNAALAILAASIMTDETVIIENLPDVRDTNVLMQAMESVGATIQKIDRHSIKVNGSTIHDVVIEDDFIKKIRASYYLLGALLGKYKRAEVALPGGCNIGSRPIDQHIKGFKRFSIAERIQRNIVFFKLFTEVRPGRETPVRVRPLNGIDCLAHYFYAEVTHSHFVYVGETNAIIEFAVERSFFVKLPAYIPRGFFYRRKYFV